MAVFRRLMLWAFDRLYNEAAWAYDLAATVAGGEFWYEWGRAVLPFVADDPVLEVGIGRGRLLVALTEAGWRPIGLDLSAAMIRYARGAVATAGLGVPLLRADGMALPFRGEAFRTLVTTFPAPYIRHAATQREFARVLRPGGRWLWADAPHSQGPPSLRGGLTTLLASRAARDDSRLIALLKRDPTGHFDVTVQRVTVGPTAIMVRVATKRAARGAVE